MRYMNVSILLNKWTWKNWIILFLTRSQNGALWKINFEVLVKKEEMCVKNNTP